MNKIFWTLVATVLISCSSDIPFDKDKWNEKHDMFYKYRKQMITDLIENHLYSKMDKREIIDLLGGAIRHMDVAKEGELEYEIYEDYGFDIDPVEVQYLTIKLNNDSTLSQVFLKTWNNSKGTEIKKLNTK